MNKAEKIRFYKGQLNSANELKAAGKNLIAQATHLESEAKRSLELLGANLGCTRKGRKVELSEELKLQITASLLK